MPTRSCGGCQFWQKWKNDEYTGGCCESWDARRRSSHPACERFRHRLKPKYNKDKTKKPRR